MSDCCEPKVRILNVAGGNFDITGTTIDFQPTANPNEYTVEMSITYTDANGVPQTITAVDPTPVTLPDTAGTVTTVPGGGPNVVTTNGVTVGPGGQYIAFPNGDTWAAPLDQFGTVATAPLALVTTNGVSVAIGEQYVTFPDGTTWASPPAGALAISTEEGNLLINGDDGNLYAMPLIADECYQESTPFNVGTPAARNVGPAVAGLVASYTATADFTIISFQPRIDNTGSGTFTVTAPGGSSDTSLESWAGAFSTVSAPVFTLDTPIAVSAGDIVVFTSNATGGRWRNNLNGTSPIAVGPSGTPSANGLSGSIQGAVFTKHNVQTYGDGETPKFIEVVGGAPTELPTIPSGWTLCTDSLANLETPADLISTEEGNVLIEGDDGLLYALPLVADECYLEETPWVEFSNNGNNADVHAVDLDAVTGEQTRTMVESGEILNVQLFVFKSNATPATATITLSGPGGTSTASVTFTAPILTFTNFILDTPLPVSAGDVVTLDVDFGGAPTNDLQLQVTNVAGGFDATPAWTAQVGAGSNSEFFRGGISGRTLTYHNVQTFSDGETTIQLEGGVPVDPTANGWTLAPHTACVDHVSTDPGNLTSLGDDELLHTASIVSEVCYRELIDAPLAGSAFDLTNFDGVPDPVDQIVLGTSQLFGTTGRQVFFELSELPFGVRLKEIRIHDVRRGNNTAQPNASYGGVNAVPGANPSAHGNGISPAPVPYTWTTSQLIVDGTPLVEIAVNQNHFGMGDGLGAAFIQSITDGAVTASGGVNDGVVSATDGFNAAFTFELSEVNTHTVRTYSDGTIISTDQDGAQTVLASIPAGWEVCPSDDYAPSHLCRAVTLPDFSTVTNSGVALNDSFPAGRDIVAIMFTAESVFTRFASMNGLQTENFVGVYHQAGSWFTDDSNEPVTIEPTDILVTEIVAAGVHQNFATAGDAFGIPSVAGGGGLVFADNAFNGAGNPGELDIVSGVFDTGTFDYLRLRVNGLYSADSDTGTQTLADAVAAGYVACDPPADADLEARVDALEAAPGVDILSDLFGSGVIDIPNTSTVATLPSTGRFQIGQLIIAGGVGTFNWTQPFGNTAYSCPAPGGLTETGRTATSISFSGGPDGNYDLIAIGTAP